MTISSIEFQRRNPERVNVFVDGRFAFGLNAVLVHELGLKKGSVVSQAVIDDVLKRDEVGKAVEACVRLLSFRPRTERELRRRLSRKGYDDQIADEAMQRMHDLGYIDDADFARFWVENREQFKPMGTRRLRSELIQKGVDKETIDEALEEQDEDQDELALRAARGKLRGYSGLDYQTFRRRMGGFLARQGFDFEVSSRTIKLLWEETQGESTEDEPY